MPEHMPELEPMPVLTLWQPWASLVALGVKTIEIRSWSTKYRGPLAIHAAVRVPRDIPEERNVGAYRLRSFGRVGWAMEGPGLPAYRSAPRLEGYLLPLGKILATCTLADVVPILDAGQDPSPGVDQWVRHVAPVRHGGDLWLWNGPSETENASTGRPSWRTEVIEGQRPYGDFTSGRFAWLLTDLVQLEGPVRFGGGQGLTRKWSPVVVHRCPLIGSNVMPCCGLPPGERLADRMTVRGTVTCQGR